MNIQVITGPITSELAAELARIQNEAYVATGMRSYQPEEIRNLLSLNNYTLYLAEDNDRTGPVGFLIEQYVAGEAEIITIAVQPDFQRKKVGKALFSALQSRVRDIPIANVFLEVAEINTLSILFYKTLGFKKNGTRKSYYTINSNSIDAIVMVKRY